MGSIWEELREKKDYDQNISNEKHKDVSIIIG